MPLVSSSHPAIRLRATLAVDARPALERFSPELAVAGFRTDGYPGALWLCNCGAMGSVVD